MIIPIGGDNEFGAKEVDRYQMTHNSETLYRKSAVIQELNTLGPISSGNYQIRLSECYGANSEGNIMALVSSGNEYFFVCLDHK
jgi:hypothetical protein